MWRHFSTRRAARPVSGNVGLSERSPAGAGVIYCWGARRSHLQQRWRSRSWSRLRRQAPTSGSSHWLSHSPGWCCRSMRWWPHFIAGFLPTSRCLRAGCATSIHALRCYRCVPTWRPARGHSRRLESRSHVRSASQPSAILGSMASGPTCGATGPGRSHCRSSCTPTWSTSRATCSSCGQWRRRSRGGSHGDGWWRCSWPRASRATWPASRPRASSATSSRLRSAPQARWRA